jgi:hypothetical protein
MRRRSLIIAAVVIVAVGAGAALWFTGRDTPDAVDIERAIADASAAPSASAGDTSGDGAGDAEATAEVATISDATGSWTVDPDFVAFDTATGTGTWVGYRIDEELSGIGAYTAVGRSPRVEGEIVIDGGRVLEAVVRADLQGLVSDNGNRDSRVRPLFADRPVVFTLTTPVDFGGVPEEGQRVAVTAQGTLRIGEIEREVSVELSADVVGSRLVVTGSTLVLLADFDVTVPSAPVVLSVSDEATIELQLFLSRS